MGGFFSNFFDSSKPGKGISKEQVQREREKVTVSGFFKILKRKFWQVVQLNLTSLVFYIPLILLFYFFISPYVMPVAEYPMTSTLPSEQAYISLWNTLNTAANNLMVQSAYLSDICTRILVAVFFTAIPLIALGPIQAGFTYILQSFIRERPVFLSHDFFKKAKSNFGQSLVVSLINLVITAIFVLELYFYNHMVANNEGSIIWTIGMGFMFVLFLVFMLMNLYIYPIIVTFNVKLRQIYKNAFLLAMSSFFPGLLILIIDAVLLVVISMLLPNPLYQLLVIALIGFGFIGLIHNYFSYKHIKYHLLDPALAAAEEKRKEEEETVFQDS